jgi:hypothetical protein
MAELQAFNVRGVAEGSQITVAGYFSVSDGGGGVFAYCPSGGIENAGTVIGASNGSGKWHRVFDGPVNVCWFGAKGDGVADDTIAIQAAINSLPVAGGIVDLGSKRYRTTTPLTMVAGLRLRGSAGLASNLPGSGTLLPCFEGDCLVFAPSVTTYANILIENLTISGATGTYATGRGIYLKNCHDVVIRNVTSGLMPQDGFSITTGCWSVVLDGCYAGNNSRYGYYIASPLISVQGHCASDGGTYSAYVDTGASDVEFDAFNFEGARVAAFGLIGVSSCRIRGGIAQDVPVAITDREAGTAAFPRRVTITGNRFRGNMSVASTGISLTNGGSYNFIISDNQIFSFANGINLSNQGWNFLSQNIVHAESGYGLKVDPQKSSSPNSVVGGYYQGTRHSILHAGGSNTSYVGVAVDAPISISGGQPTIISAK